MDYRQSILREAEKVQNELGTSGTKFGKPIPRVSAGRSVQESIVVRTETEELETPFDHEITSIIKELQWTDPYFEDNRHTAIMAVFDFDREEAERFLGANYCPNSPCDAILLLICPIFIPCAISSMFRACRNAKNARQWAEALHLAITPSGILYITNNEILKGTGLRDCRYVPYNDIESVKIDARSCCLVTIKRNSPSWEANPPFEEKRILAIPGLEKPEHFLRLVNNLRYKHTLQEIHERNIAMQERMGAVHYYPQHKHHACTEQYQELKAVCDQLKRRTQWLEEQQDHHLGGGKQHLQTKDPERSDTLMSDLQDRMDRLDQENAELRREREIHLEELRQRRT